jgi:hypothetical protein
MQLGHALLNRGKERSAEALLSLAGGGPDVYGQVICT